MNNWIKNKVRQWLCTHKHTTPIRKLALNETFGAIKSGKNVWLEEETQTIKFERWDRCTDCNKCLSVGWDNLKIRPPQQKQ